MSTSLRPSVTIAVPTYNRADGYLAEALESALVQTYGHLEILVSDNCSTDGTAELVRSYDDPRIRYVRHETNQGAHGNFEYCLDAARGDFFLMLHDDDRIDSDFIETCVAALGDDPAGSGYVRTGNRLIDGTGGVVQERPNEAAGTSGVSAVLGWMGFQNYWALSSTLYETAALRAIGGFPTQTFPLTFDCYASARIALQGGGIELEAPRASFRIHDGEITHRMAAREWIDEWGRLRDAVVSWAPTEADRSRLQREGDAFFSVLSFQYARKIEAFLPRLAAYASIMARFRQLPPSLRYRVATWRNQLRRGRLPG